MSYGASIAVAEHQVSHGRRMLFMIVVGLLSLFAVGLLVMPRSADKRFRALRDEHHESALIVDAPTPAVVGDIPPDVPAPVLQAAPFSRIPSPRPTVVERCPQSDILVNGVRIGNVYSTKNESAIRYCPSYTAWMLRNRTFRAIVRQCTGIGEFDDPAHRWETRLVRNMDPIYFPMHGGVSAKRMAKLSLQLMAHCPLRLGEYMRWPNRTVIVELGSGNSAALSVMVPPAPHIYGVGTDIAASLVEHATEYFPHLLVHRAIGAPMVPTGSATCVFSIGVLLVLNFNAACNYIGEALRLLSPGGVLVLHGVPRKSSRVGVWTSYHEWFFVNESVFFPTCTHLRSLVESVQFVSKPYYQVYSYPDAITVKVVRNSAPLHCAATDLEATSPSAAEIASAGDAFFLESDRLRAGRDAFAQRNSSWYKSRLELVLGAADTPPWLRQFA